MEKFKGAEKSTDLNKRKVLKNEAKCDDKEKTQRKLDAYPSLEILVIFIFCCNESCLLISATSVEWSTHVCKLRFLTQ